MTFDQPLSRIKTSHGMYALLIAANVLMGFTVLLQGQVIENQRLLIKNLFYDHMHLAAFKAIQPAAPSK